MACPRISPMNNLFRLNRNDAIDRNRLDSPTFHREIGKQPRRRAHVRRRRGGRLFALGGLLLLAGGLTLGGWGNYSLKQEVMATARQQHDFVLSLHVATVEANPATISVTLPGTTAAVAEANVSAQENLLKLLQQNRDYASVVAPFDGVITQRNVDVGSLVQGNAASGSFMFEIMQDNVIRVWVYVPQDSAFGVAPGIDAVIRVPELPDREFSGKVTRIADALQSGTRTLLTEIDISNPDSALAPGIYCTVELHIPRKTPSLLVSADAIIFNRNGMQVAVVNNGKAELRKVKVKRDLGTRVEVDSGIKAGDQVILNPPVTLVDGSKVQAMPEAPRT